jgi:large subunit ribosomal protein L10
MTAIKKISKGIELKKKKVASLTHLLDQNKTIGIVNLASLPAKQLKAVRAKLRDKITFIFEKKTVLKRAFEASKKPQVKHMAQHMDGVYPAIVVSQLDAFEMFRLLKSSRQMVAAKPGQIAPADITISAGPTPFAPGPAISELAQLGLKTKVEGGKIAIREDAVVVKQGQPVPPLAASMLTKLGITPMQIGVTLTYVLEDADLYNAPSLDVDVDKYTQDLKTAVLNAFTLAIELGFATKETINLLVQKAYRGAKALDDKVPKAAQETQVQA